MTTNKQSAIDFLALVIAGSIDEAYEKHVAMEGKHHNIYFPPGFSILKQAMKDDHSQHPNKIFSVKHALEDGDMVAVHSHLSFDAKSAGFAVTHLFRFEAGRIIEMWDCVMQLSAESPNTDGAF